MIEAALRARKNGLTPSFELVRAERLSRQKRQESASSECH